MSKILLSRDEAREYISERLEATLNNLEESMDALLCGNMCLYFEHAGTAAHFALSACEHIEHIDDPAFLCQLKNTLLSLGELAHEVSGIEANGALLLESAIVTVDTFAILSQQAAPLELVAMRNRIADKYMQLTMTSSLC